MKKYMAIALILMLALSGCGGGTTGTETQAAEAENTGGTGEDSAAEAAEGIGGEEVIGTGSVDLTGLDVSKYVTLGNYTGFDIDLLTSEVTEYEIESEEEALLQSLATKTDTGEAAKDEDYIDVSYQLVVDEEVWDEDPEYQMLLGFCNLGEEVDAALLGANVGDTFKIDVNMQELYEIEDAAGYYELEVLKIYQYNVPELTDALIKENTEYQTVAEYEAGITAKLLADSQRNNHYDAEERALAEAVEYAEFNGYDQELYDYIYSAYEELYSYYAEMYGMTVEELAGEGGIEESVIGEVNTMMAVKAIADAAKVELTEDAYETYLKENYPDYGFESVEELKANCSENYLKNYALRSLVGTYIMENSNVVEMDEVTFNQKYYGFDEEEELLAEEDMDDEVLAAMDEEETE